MKDYNIIKIDSRIIQLGDFFSGKNSNNIDIIKKICIKISEEVNKDCEIKKLEKLQLLLHKTIENTIFCENEISKNLEKSFFNFSDKIKSILEEEKNLCECSNESSNSIKFVTGSKENYSTVVGE